MVTYDELKKGAQIIIDGQPYEIIESSLMFKGRGHSTLTAKLKNLLTGNAMSRTFQPSDAFEEAEILKFSAKFVYVHRGNYVFSTADNPSKRFELGKSQLGDNYRFLKTNQSVEALQFKDKIINIVLPIKCDYRVSEAPPGVKGDRSQSGNKQVTIETGAVINVPLFVEQDDIVEINTESGEYVRRVE